MNTRMRFFHDSVFYEIEPPSVISDLIDRKQIIRCPRCQCILFKGVLGDDAKVEVECRRCKLKVLFVSVS